MPIIVTVVVFVAICYALGLAVGVVAAPVVVVVMVAGALAESSRRARGREEARERAEGEREGAEARARAAREQRVRPTGVPRFAAFGWSYDLFDVEGRPGAVLAVFEPYTDHSVGYLFEDHETGEECAGVYPRPSREFPGDTLWMHRPDVGGLDDLADDWSLTHRVVNDMLLEISSAYGCKPVEGAPGGTGRRS